MNNIQKPLWEECECCGDTLCNFHRVHVYDCSCPDIDTMAWWDIYPYEAGSLKKYEDKVQEYGKSHSII